MGTDDWPRIKNVLLEVQARPPSERPKYLEAACGDDEALRVRIADLLEHDEEAAARMEPPTATPEAGTNDLVGSTVGQYDLRRVIGTGGMGTVYEAAQDHPNRLVALKVLHRGAASSQMVARFRHEAEILGRLRHPNIAQVHEAGTFDSGEGARPYFAMEFVRGRPLQRHCDEEKLGTQERLQLFVKICDAVQCAHHHGVIHRDLKPDNILVDEFGEPKVLDFGVARITDSDIKATTLRTDIGQLIGTVPYMSPEQVTGDPHELDTRSDVYTLGVVLYELLCGRLPYKLLEKSIPEAARVIREDDPTPLSSVNRVFRGDLETIVAKALEKDKDRRYQTAAELSADIRHFLADEPIFARPASTFYQLRKFTRRNRALVVGIAAVFVVLTAGAVVSTVLAIGQARARADAQRQADVAKAVNAFLTDDMLTAGDLLRGSRGGLTVANMLEQAGTKIESRFEGEPLAELTIRLAFGWAYYRLGNLKGALPHLEAAYELSRETLGEGDVITLEAMHRLGVVYYRLQQNGDAEPLLSSVVKQRRNLPEERLRLLWSVHYLGLLRRNLGLLDEAETLVREAYEGKKALLGDEAVATLVAMHSLISIYMAQDRYEDAERLCIQSLEKRIQRFGDDHWLTAQTRLSYGQLFVRQHRFDEAEPLVRQALAVYQQKLPEDHFFRLGARVVLGYVLHGQGAYEDAETEYTEALERATEIQGPGHPILKGVLRSLVSLYESWDKPEKAAEYQKLLQEAGGAEASE